MKYLVIIVALMPIPSFAQDKSVLLQAAVTDHIIPRYQQLADSAQSLEVSAQQNCQLDSPDLRVAYHSAFDAWIGVSHLRFGPSEVDNRAFSLAFWPDKRGFTNGALTTLISAEDPVVDSPELFAKTSIAGRGFFALDMLLFDAQFQNANADYTCRLVKAISIEISDVADTILHEWRTEYGTYLMTAGSETNPVYLTESEGIQELFKAVLTGLEFTQTQRLGRPMGTFDRPRPNRAEAYRSGRSLRNIILALQATEDLGNLLATYVGSGLGARVDAGLAFSVRLAKDLDDPILAGVSAVNGRFRVEALQSSIVSSIAYITTELGPALGVNSGFNALDGD